MTAYRLQAKHSLTNDRARGTRRSDAVIQLRCTLTVYLLVLQPLVDKLLRLPLSGRRPRAISITNIISYRESMGAGARTWTFTITLYTRDKKVRTHTWWGRRLPQEQIEELPLALLRRLETVLNYAWYSLNRNRATLKNSVGTLLVMS
ncbi:MAG TPA: hypothetical protein VJM46_03770 [Candidatus Saccharimonadales bacterium]|nr:hypothetical protein [Candidatus Saccharimonadales bacterium]